MAVAGSIISGIVSDAQDCADASELRSRVLARLAGPLSFDSAIVLPVRADVGLPASVGKDRKVVSQFLAQRERYELDTRKGWEAAKAGGGAFIDTEVYTLDERLNLPFFAEIIRPQGITSQLVAHVTFQQRKTCIIHLCRHGRTRPFRSRDLERFLPILPSIGVSHAAFDGAAATRAQSAAETPAHHLAEVGAFRELFGTLSPREREIARYVAYGYRNRDIALAVGSSPHTVRNHLYQVFAKLGTTGRTELAVWMERSGLAVRSY
jgi:DNA-binding CsgD family transcriptional regulator